MAKVLTVYFIQVRQLGTARISPIRQWAVVYPTWWFLVQGLSTDRQWLFGRFGVFTSIIFKLDEYNIFSEYYLAMTPGGTTYETTQLNIESLWTGGPFADPVSSFVY
jgi:hypothetical protein